MVYRPFNKFTVDQEVKSNALSIIEGQNLMKFYTYIILCQNNKYYVGHSNNPDARLIRHLQKSGAKFTAQNMPIKILWKQKFNSELEAIRRENQIKGWARKKKENLINKIWK